MAKSTTGKWVSRVGSAGGGKTYQRTRPGNYYGVLAVIVVLGLILTIYSRYEYQNPVKKHSTAIAPVIGSTLYSGLSIQACGKSLPFLSSDPNFRGGFVVENDNVIRLTPGTASEAGNNATLTTFSSEYPGLFVTKKKLAVPTAKGAANPKTTYVNGDKCPATSKYAGQTGHVVYAYWSTLAKTTPTLTTNPASIKFAKDLRLTLAFEPKGVTPTPPSKATTDEMVLYSVSTTTTTTLPVTTTTAATTTTGPTTTTTASTTTTTKG